MNKFDFAEDTGPNVALDLLRQTNAETIGSFDFATLQNANPMAVLRILQAKRGDPLCQTLSKEIPEYMAKGMRWGRYLWNECPCLAPANPLLLATALSLAITTSRDVTTLIYHYIGGLNTQEIEEHLVHIPSLGSLENLNNFLRLEETYVEALLLLAWELITSIMICVPFAPRLSALEEARKFYEIAWLPPAYSWLKKRSRILPNGAKDSDPVSSLAQYILLECKEQQFSPERLPSNWLCDKFSLQFFAWLFVNPIYSTFRDAKPARDCLLQRGRNHYGQIIRAKDYYKRKSNDINKQVNLILQANIPRNEKKSLLETHKNEQVVTALLETRARRLYEWTPEEIIAFKAAEVIMKRELGPKLGYSDPNDFDQSSLSELTKALFTGDHATLKQILREAKVSPKGKSRPVLLFESTSTWIERG